MGEVERRESGLFVAHGFGFLKHRAVVKTVTLPNGERAKVTIDDSGTVKHIEHGDHVDAIASPKPIHVKLRYGRVDR